MSVKFTNNAETTLASGINSSVTSLTVASSSGFPTITTGEYFYVTLDDGTNNEIVKVTAVSGTTWTIVRAQDNTTARSFSSSNKVELRVTAGLITDAVADALASSFAKNAFTGDGTETDFTLSQSPNSKDDLIVFIEGVFQNQSTYSLSGTTLSFSTAPANQRAIVVYTVKAAVSGANLNHDQFTASGSAAFTLSIAPINENNTQVFIDGVYQQKTDYAVSGTTLTFDTAPASGAIVEVMTFTQTEVNVPAADSVTTASIADNVGLGGSPTTTTQSASDNSTKIATTAYVTTAVANIIDSAPDTLNTLNEIAAALNDDANFNTTVTNSIASKMPLAGGTFTGDVTFNGTNLYFNGAASSANYNLALENSDTFTSFYGATDATVNKGYKFYTGNQSGDLALTIDAAGKATFTGGIVSNAGVVVDNITIDGTEIDLSSGDLTLDVAGDIILDADGGDITFKDGGTEIAHLSNSSSDFLIQSAVNDKDIIFKGVDNSSAITALTLDMSDAGKATFNSGVVAGGTVQAQIAGFFLTENTTDAFSISSNGANGILKIRDEYNSADRLTIAQNGSVGIGETSPLGKLHIKEDDSGVSSINSNFDQLVLEDDLHSGMTILSGTSGDGAIYFGDSGSNDIGQIKYKHSSNQLDLTTSGQTRLTINSSGSVGIGETNPAAPLHVEHSSATAYNGASEITESLIVSNKNGTDNSGVNNVASIGLHVADGATSQGFINYVRDGNNTGKFTLSQRTAASTYEENYTFARTGELTNAGSQPALFLQDTTAGGGAGNGGQVIFKGHHAGSGDGFREFAKILGLKQNATGGDTHGELRFYVNKGAASTSEVGRFNHDGDFLVATTIGVGSFYNGVNGVGFGYSPNGYGCMVRAGTAQPLYVSTTGQGSGGFIEMSQNGAVRGIISFNGSVMVYGGTSDYRLKENVTPIENALTKISALKPINFDWKENGANADGFLAHEAQEIVPYAVQGEKDQVYTDENSPEEKKNGEPFYQTMEYGKLTPLLVKAIQEQQTIIEDLKARIETLEG